MSQKRIINRRLKQLELICNGVKQNANDTFEEIQVQSQENLHKFSKLRQKAEFLPNSLNYNTEFQQFRSKIRAKLNSQRNSQPIKLKDKKGYQFISFKQLKDQEFQEILSRQKRNFGYSKSPELDSSKSGQGYTIDRMQSKTPQMTQRKKLNNFVIKSFTFRQKKLLSQAQIKRMTFMQRQDESKRFKIQNIKVQDKITGSNRVVRMFNYEEPKSPKSPILLPSKSLQKLPSFSTFSGMKAKTIVEEIHTEPISTKELLTIEKMTKGMHKAK